MVSVSLVSWFIFFGRAARAACMFHRLLPCLVHVSSFCRCPFQMPRDRQPARLLGAPCCCSSRWLNLTPGGVGENSVVNILLYTYKTYTYKPWGGGSSRRHCALRVLKPLWVWGVGGKKGEDMGRRFIWLELLETEEQETASEKRTSRHGTAPLQAGLSGHTGAQSSLVFTVAAFGATPRKPDPRRVSTVAVRDDGAGSLLTVMAIQLLAPVSICYSHVKRRGKERKQSRQVLKESNHCRWVFGQEPGC